MKGYNEDDFLMISGIQHFRFCRRQWALIHIEQQWQENVRTVEGKHLHERADQPEVREKRGDRLIVRALPVHSFRLGISGICDVVEFIRDPNGFELAGETGTYQAIPIEYKRGKPKRGDEDTSQLLAQAVCLEEMLACNIDRGFLYYHEIRHRVEVVFGEQERRQLEQYVAE